MMNERIDATHQGNIVLHYRKLKKMSRWKLAELLEVDVSTIYRMENQALIKDAKRRQLLVELLGIPAALMSLDLASHPFVAPLMINDDQMGFFEQELATRWDIYHTGGTTRAFQGFDTWLKQVQSFTKDTGVSAWRERAHALLLMSYQLHGSILRDMMKYEQAHASYQQAVVVEIELDDHELMDSALARRGVTYIQQNKSTDAVVFLNEALHLIDGYGLPYLRGYILQALSEAYAMSQQPQASWRMIDLAERALERKGSALERSYCQANTTSTTAQKGVNAVLLHENDRAIALIEKGLSKYDPTLVRGRARLLAQQAEAYQGIGDIDMCTATATDALNLALSVGSKKTYMRVQNVHTTLKKSSRAKEKSVLHLGVLLSQ